MKVLLGKVRKAFWSLTEPKLYNLEQVMGEHFPSTANREWNNNCRQLWKTKETEHRLLSVLHRSLGLRESRLYPFQQGIQ